MSQAAAGPELGLISRAIGVMTSPTATFRSVAASPRPAGILFVVCLLIGLATGAVQMTDRGRTMTLDMQVRIAQQQSGEPLPAEARQGMERMAPYLGVISLVSTFIFVPVVTIVIGGLYWLIFNVVLGGTADFKQVLGVVAHAAIIGAVGAVIAAPIQYAQGVMTPAGPFHLGAVAPMLDPRSLIGQLLTSLTFFGVWQAVVTGIGLSVLYKRRATGVVVAMLVIYVGFTAVFWVGLPALFMRR